MHRDPEITRRILLAIDTRPDSKPQGLEIDGIEKETLLRHIELLFNDGMLEGEPLHYSSEGGPEGHLPDCISIRDMTPKGHDLLGIMKNDGVWTKIKSSFTASELAGMSFSVVRKVGILLLEDWAKKKVGL